MDGKTMMTDGCNAKGRFVMQAPTLCAVMSLIVVDFAPPSSCINIIPSCFTARVPACLLFTYTPFGNTTRTDTPHLSRVSHSNPRHHGQKETLAGARAQACTQLDDDGHHLDRGSPGPGHRTRPASSVSLVSPGARARLMAERTRNGWTTKSTSTLSDRASGSS